MTEPQTIQQQLDDLHARLDELAGTQTDAGAASDMHAALVRELFETFGLAVDCHMKQAAIDRQQAAASAERQRTEIKASLDLLHKRMDTLEGEVLKSTFMTTQLEELYRTHVARLRAIEVQLQALRPINGQLPVKVERAGN